MKKRDRIKKKRLCASYRREFGRQWWLRLASFPTSPYRLKLARWKAKQRLTTFHRRMIHFGLGGIYAKCYEKGYCK